MMSESFSFQKGNFAYFPSCHFAPMQTGPTNLVDESVGQTDCAGQLDTSNEAKYIHPHFNGHPNNHFPKIENGI
jgi:hypothetical protein